MLREANTTGPVPVAVVNARLWELKGCFALVFALVSEAEFGLHHHQK
jgi:hypothetical protein